MQEVRTHSGEVPTSSMALVLRFLEEGYIGTPILNMFRSQIGQGS